MNVSTTPLIKAVDLTKEYRSSRHRLRALDHVSFEVAEGESVALVGESGAGKSTLARLLIRAIAPSSGSLFYRGEEVSSLRGGKAFKAYWKRVQMVSQDPTTTFDPKCSIAQALAEPLRYFGTCDRGEVGYRSEEVLDLVGLSGIFLDRFPAEMSGGELQRASIARALAVQPECLILDEATSALDMTIQEALLELLARIRVSENLTYVFIHHDLAVAQRVSDRLIVMRRGRIEEELPSYELAHSDSDYVQSLLRASFAL